MCGFWREGPQSIQQVIESDEYRALIAAGLGGGRLFIPFPVDSTFRDYTNDVEIFLRKDRDRLCDAIKDNVRNDAVVVPVSSGTRYSDQAFSRITSVIDDGNSSMVTFNVSIEGNGSQHSPRDTATPWNVAMRGEAVLSSPESYLTFVTDCEHVGLANQDRCSHCDEPTAEISNPAIEKEYRLFAGIDVSVEELQADIRNSNVLLKRFVSTAIDAGRPELINRQSFALLNRLSDFPVSDDVDFNKLKNMDTLASNAKWSELLAESSRIITDRSSAQLKIKDALYRATANAGLHSIDAAMTNVRQALDLDPASIPAHFMLGKMLLARGDFAGASNAFSFCSDRNQHDHEAVRLLAYSQYKSINYERALQILEYQLKAFDFDHETLRFMLHTAYRAGNMQLLSKYANYIEPYPPLPADFAEKEWIIMHELLRNADHEAWVVDVGANVGDMSRTALTWGHNCLSVEPDNDLYPQLEQNLSGFSARSVICRCGCSSENSTGELYIGLERGFNTLDDDVRKTLHFRYDRNPEIKSISLKRLDQILTENGINRVSLLKIDTEGHDLEVLHGLDWPWYDSIEHVMFEFNMMLPSKMKAAIYFLFACGFQHGLIFQHSNEYPSAYRLSKLEMNKEIAFDSACGTCGNILMSKRSPFEMNEIDFIDVTDPIPYEEIRGRLIE